mgnify:CR=1 FL=1
MDGGYTNLFVNKFAFQVNTRREVVHHVSNRVGDAETRNEIKLGLSSDAGLLGFTTSGSVGIPQEERFENEMKVAVEVVSRVEACFGCD